MLWVLGALGRLELLSIWRLVVKRKSRFEVLRMRRKRIRAIKSGARMIDLKMLIKQAKRTQERIR